MKQTSNISMSISLVQKELESTLQKAESYFSAYAEDQESGNLKLLADELNLARGTFKLLELSGPEALTTEMLTLISDGAIQIDIKLEALGQAIICLSNYIGMLLEREQDLPSLLIPIINILRKAGRHKPIPESHFFLVNLRPKLPSIEKSTLDIKPHLGRLRLMYQAGLLRVLKSDDPKLGYKLIDRSLVLLERGFRGTLAWSFWWVAKGALEVMIQEDYELTSSRRLLFGRIDQIMRHMIKDGIQVFTAQQANEAQKELLYLVSLAESKSSLIEDIKNCYQLKSSNSEAQLKLERHLLAGPDVDVYDSLSIAFKGEIALIKSALDQISNNTLTDEGFSEVDNKLLGLAGVLRVIHQNPLADKVEKQRSKITDLKNDDGEAKVSALVELADALLQVELACDLFAKGEVSEQEGIIGAGHYAEARIVLLDEIQSGISLTKRAMASFMDSRDKLHLANIRPALDGVRGAWVFMNDLKAARIIECTADYFDNKVLNGEQNPDEARLEVLADALTSVEYYAETLTHSGDKGADILELAVKSMGQLGFKI